MFLTDGRIVTNGLCVLENDQSFSTAYNPCLNVRSEAVQRNSKLTDIFNDIAAELDTSTLRDLNAQVDVDVGGRRPDQVARSFLEANGFTG